MMTPWSAMAAAVEPFDSTFAPTAASDRRGDVGVGGHGQVDRRGDVEAGVEVGVEVEQRDDLLGRQGGRPFGGELLRRQGVSSS